MPHDFHPKEPQQSAPAAHCWKFILNSCKSQCFGWRERGRESVCLLAYNTYHIACLYACVGTFGALTCNSLVTLEPAIARTLTLDFEAKMPLIFKKQFAIPTWQSFSVGCFAMFFAHVKKLLARQWGEPPARAADILQPSSRGAITWPRVQRDTSTHGEKHIFNKLKPTLKQTHFEPFPALCQSKATPVVCLRLLATP